MSSTSQLLLTKSSTHCIRMEALCVKSKSLRGICRRWYVQRDPSNTAPLGFLSGQLLMLSLHVYMSASVTTVEVPSWSFASWNSHEFPYTLSGIYAINWHGWPIVTCQDSMEKLREVAGDCGDRKLMCQQGGSNIHPRTLDDVSWLEKAKVPLRGKSIAYNW